MREGIDSVEIEWIKRIDDLRKELRSKVLIGVIEDNENRRVGEREMKLKILKRKSEVGIKIERVMVDFVKEKINKRIWKEKNEGSGEEKMNVREREKRIKMEMSIEGWKLKKEDKRNVENGGEILDRRFSKKELMLMRKNEKRNERRMMKELRIFWDSIVWKRIILRVKRESGWMEGIIWEKEKGNKR